MLSTGSRTAPYRGRSAAFGWARAGELGILQDRQGLTRCPRKMFPLPRDPAVYPSPLHFKKFASRSPLPSLGQRRSPRNSCTSFFPRIFPPAPPPEPEHTSPQAVDVPRIGFLPLGGVGWGGVYAPPFVSPNAKTVVTLTPLSSPLPARSMHAHSFWKEYLGSSYRIPSHLNPCVLGSKSPAPRIQGWPQGPGLTDQLIPSSRPQQLVQGEERDSN